MNSRIIPKYYATDPKKTVSQKIDLKVEWPRNGHAASLRVNILKKTNSLFLISNYRHDLVWDTLLAFQETYNIAALQLADKGAHVPEHSPEISYRDQKIISKLFTEQNYQQCPILTMKKLEFDIRSLPVSVFAITNFLKISRIILRFLELEYKDLLDYFLK